MVGVTAHQVHAEQVAVVVGLGFGVTDVALAVVVVHAVRQRSVNEVIALLKTAVQRESVAVDFSLAARLAIHIGVQVAVRQTQRQLIVELAVRTDRDPAAVRIKPGHAIAHVLIGIAVQGLHPNAGFLERVT